VADSESTPATQSVTLNFDIFGSIQIAAVEFTQVIQQFQLLDELKTSLTTNGEPPVPIVSGKRAVMRVYFTSVDQAKTVIFNASGDVAGQKQFDVPPGCEPADQRSHALPKQCPSVDIYFIPPSGTFSTTLTLSDAGGGELEQEILNVTSRDALAINLKGVWVCTTPTQPSSCQDPSSLLTLKALAEKILPTNSVTVDITTQRISEDVTQYSPEAWVDAVVDRLIEQYTPQDFINDGALSQRTDYTGVYNHIVASSTTGIAGLGAHGVLIPDVAPRLSADPEQTTEMVLAHEVGHSLSLVHTDNPNPAATTAPGCYGSGVGGGGTPTNWPYADNYVQDSAGLETGFDVAAAAVIPAGAYFDVISYCVPRWITPLNYKKALLFANPGPAAAPSQKGRHVSAATSSAAQPRANVTYTQGTYWSVSGSLPSAGGATLRPIFTEAMMGTADPGSGTYSIQLENASGQVIYTRYFTPVIGSTDTTGADFNTDPLFTEFIPAMAGTSAIVITDPIGNTLTSLPMTGTAPTVTIISPGAGFTGTGDQTLAWNVSNTSAASFTSRIYYSVDGGTTWEELDETTGMTDTLDFDTLPGTSAALIRVDVSDGMNTGTATSVPFNVAKKLPSAIVINSPGNGSVRQAANPVYLTGGAFDADDGVLTGKALVWSDSVQGSLGSGSPLTAKLNAGVHTISLTATDSDGNALTASTQITLGGAPPTLTLTTTQNATCYGATINASPGAQGASLTAVNYSLDGGASYTGIPLTNLPFTLPLNGTGAVNVAAVAVDASGQVSSQSSAVNLGTGCTGATVKASAGSGQSAVVGTAFTSALTTLVVDLTGAPVSGAAVTYAAPATGASAMLSVPTAITNASGLATVTAIANSTAGAYNVTATATNGTSTATFALTNSDFQITAGTSALTVPRGSTNTDAITLNALGGFNGTVTFGCSGLPAGTTCTFAPATVTPTTATASTTMTIAASQSAWLRWPAGGGLVVACALLAFFLRRRKYFTGLAIIACAIGLISLTACGGSSSTTKTTGSTTATVTVTGTAGAAQRTTTVTLTIQ